MYILLLRVQSKHLLQFQPWLFRCFFVFDPNRLHAHETKNGRYHFRTA